MDEAIGADVGLEKMAEAVEGGLEADVAAGENAVEIVVEGLEIRLVEGDEPARRRAAEIVREGAQQVLEGVADEVEEAVDGLGLEPGVAAEPGGINEMVQGDDGLEAVGAAIGDALGVTVERALVEGRGARRRREGPRAGRARWRAGCGTIRCSCETR